MKQTWEVLLNDLMETWGTTVSLVSNLNDCYLKLSSKYKKENSELARSVDDPLYENLLDLESETQATLESSRKSPGIGGSRRRRNKKSRKGRKGRKSRKTRKNH